MFKKNLKSQKGFAFADVLGAAVIVGVSLIALFMIIFSSKIRVTNDYHYRKALLAALSKMELIKYNNRSEFNGNLNLNISGLNDDVILDESYRPVLEGRTKIDIKTTFGLLEVSQYAARKEVTVKIEWTEKSSAILTLFKPRKTNVVMREDYYYEFNPNN